MKKFITAFVLLCFVSLAPLPGASSSTPGELTPLLGAEMGAGVAMGGLPVVEGEHLDILPQVEVEIRAVLYRERAQRERRAKCMRISVSIGLCVASLANISLGLRYYFK